ncbi:MAG TPA: DUF4331 domain-containing protein [Herpetosiphonaceae bacterium]
MRKFVSIVCVMAALVIGATASLPERVGASSHREAPLISADPQADNTDVYAFVSPDRPDTVTLIANYIPLQEPAGGPNFNNFGDDVFYEIKVSNDMDAQREISFQFAFSTQTRNKNTFLYNTGPITALDDPDWNIRQFYTVRRTEYKNGGVSSSKVLGSNLPVPPVNVGPRSTPNYAALASAAVRDLPGGYKVFAGQRDDPFFVDLGSVFDLAGLRPFNPAHIIPLPEGGGVDGVGGYNVHTIALQVPIKELTRDGKMPSGINDPSAVIGVHATAKRRSTRVLRNDGTVRYSGDYVQVSRLGNPLINEVVIPLGRKDYWNATRPQADQQFAQYYTSPEVTKLENLLYPALDNAAETNRNDLVAILLTGVKIPAGKIPGVENLNFTGNTKADLLRLNMAVPPSANPSRLGVLEGDLAGFPNGRRLADDVTDVELRALAEGYGPILNAVLGLPNRAPNNALGDGVDVNDLPFLATFPYVSTPHQGYEHMHHVAIGSSNVKAE